MARSFNGTSDYIHGGAAFTVLPCSVACWAKNIEQFNAQLSLLGVQCVGASAPYVSLHVPQAGGVTRAAFDVAGEFGDSASVLGTVNLNGNTNWHHFAGTYSGIGGSSGNYSGTAAVYTDGADKQTSALSTANPWYTAPDPPNTSLIGVSGSTPAGFWHGSIADAAMWNVVLSDLEIAGLARGLRPWMIRPKNLVGYWPIDGYQSPEPDLSGFAHNGTLVGTALDFGPPTTLFTKPQRRFELFVVPPTEVIGPLFDYMDPRDGLAA